MSKRGAQKQSNRVVRDQLAAERRRTRTRWISVIAALVLVVAAVAGWGIYRSQRPQTYAVPAGVTNVGGQDAGVVVAGTGPVTVEVYLDFLCPACKQFETATFTATNQLITDGKVRVIWHPLGFLDRATNPPGYSTRAAAASACAADANKIGLYGMTLFANQPAEGSAGLTDDQLIDLGGAAGLNAPSFAQCVRQGKYVGWVGNVNQQAAKRGVNATPTVFVNGKELPAPTAEALTAAVAAA